MKASRNRSKSLAAFVSAALAMAAAAALAGVSAPFPLDTRSGTRVAGEVESIAYSTEWNRGGSVRVSADGVVLAEATAPASGDVAWNAAAAGAGFHTLTHVSGGETLTATFAVGREVATVTLSGLSQVYDGTPKPVAVETVPEGLAVAVTYDGNGEAPTEAGRYVVAALVDNGVLAGGAVGMLEIAKGRQTIEFAEIGVQETTNTLVLDATASSGLGVAYAVEGPAVLDGNVLAFTGVGTVRVVASQAGDGNWEAAEAVARVFGVGLATVTLGGLSQVYDGTPKPVAVETDPAGLAVAVTYDGSGEAPTGAGRYAVRAEVESDVWVGSAEGVLEIAKGTQTIAFAAIGTQKTTNTVVLGATASSGLDVSYAVEGPAVVDGNVLTFTGEEGTVRVVASQAGDGNWAAAAAERAFAVKKPMLPGISAPFPLDTRSGTRIAEKLETIVYSTEWNHGGSVRVAADGVVLAEAAAPASGEVVWNSVEAGVGLHTLTHTSGGETLTAVFQVEGQKVAFNANGGNCPVASALYPKGGKYAHLPDAEREGFTFLGWFNALEEGNRVTTNHNVTSAGKRTLWAHWSESGLPRQQTVRFNAQGGTCAVAAMRFDFGGKYTGLPEAEREGFTFLGWFKAAEGGNRVTTNHNVTAGFSRTLWAHWGESGSPERQIVRFDAQGGTCDTATMAFDFGGKYGNLPEAEWTGHTFLGWFAAADRGNQVTTNHNVTVALSRTLWAHWSESGWPNRQTVWFKSQGGSSPSKMEFGFGGKYAGLPEAEWDGHTFLGWFTSSGGGNRVKENNNVTAALSRTLWAHWGDASAAGLSISSFSLKLAGGFSARGARDGDAQEGSIGFEAVAGRVYELQWTPSLGGQWMTLRRWVADAAGESRVDIPPLSGEAIGFFRLVMPAASGE